MMVMPSLTLFEVAALGFQPPKAMLHQLRATPWVGKLGGKYQALQNSEICDGLTLTSVLRRGLIHGGTGLRRGSEFLVRELGTVFGRHLPM